MNSLKITILRLSKKLSLARNMADIEVQNYTTRLILSTPYQRATKELTSSIVGENYIPGLFFLSDRKKNPSFLLHENRLDYYQWVEKKIKTDLQVLKKMSDLKSSIINYGEENIIFDIKNILSFKTEHGFLFDEVISNQIYSDIFRRMILLLVKSDIFYKCSDSYHFNKLAYITIPKVLKKTSHYTLYERLVQSTIAGGIGIDSKNNLTNTSSSSIDSIIPFNIKETSEEKVLRIYHALDDNVHKQNPLKIDFYKEYEKDVVMSHKKTVCWVFDDYIQTMFELKFIEEQLTKNDTLSFTIVPRFASYFNDVSYNDIIDFLKLDIFIKLKGYYEIGRVSIIRDGMDISTFDGTRMSETFADAIKRCDVLVMSGARAYEMAQGINKKTYFMGIVVCKEYTESITGFSKNSGAPLFIMQYPRIRTFHGFRERATRRMHDINTGNIFPCAAYTAREYADENGKCHAGCFEVI